jgi:hypothetical protein
LKIQFHENFKEKNKKIKKGRGTYRADFAILSVSLHLSFLAERELHQRKASIPVICLPR